MGGDRRSADLEEHASVLLDQVARTPDLTLAELKGRLSRRGVKTSLSAIARLLTRHGLTYKKRQRMPPSSNSQT